MTNLQDLLFDVEMIDNPKNTNSEYSKIVVGNIDGVETDLNYCSPRFNLLKNENVFPKIEEMLDNANCVFSKGYRMNEDMTTFHAQYIIHSKDGVNVGIDIGGTGDFIYPTAIVDNSYNGQTQGALTFGYFRMICSNGLVIPLEGKEESNFIIKGKHTKQLSFSFELLLTKINLFLDKQDKMQKKFEVLTDRIVPTFEERIVEVLSATNTAASKPQFVNIANTIRKEAKQLSEVVDENGVSNFKGINDFLIYNGINAHIYKGEDSEGNKSKALPEVKRKQDKKVFSYMMTN